MCLCSERSTGAGSLFGDIQQYLNCERHVILLGDFNCVCFPEDKSKLTSVCDKSALLLSSIVRQQELEDIGYVLSSENHTMYTHYQGQCHGRLDRIYAPLTFVPLFSSYQVLHVSFSDHCLVMSTIGKKQKPSKFSWDLWKLNDKLLQDDVFQKAVQEKLENLLSITTSAFFIAEWELFKRDVKFTAIERACVVCHKEKEREKELHLRLKYMLSAESSSPGLFSKEIKEVKSELEVIDEEKYRGAVLRARAERLWMGETLPSEQ